MIKRFISAVFSTYRRKLLAAIFFINIIMFIILLVNRVVLMREFIFDRVQVRVESLGQILSDELAESLAEKDIDDVRENLGIVARQPSMQFLSVLDLRKRVLYSSDPALEGRRTPYAGNVADRIEQDGLLVRMFPLVGNAGLVGYLQIGFSLRAMRTDLQRGLVWALCIDAVMLLLVLFVAWVVSGVLLRPLTEMKEVSQAIASGDFTARAHATSCDIIGQLAEALNSMAAQLGELTDHMQHKIEKAVHELAMSNRELQIKTVQLEAFNTQLMELDTLKSDFVSMVSHELRTPVTSIMGFANTLLTLTVSDTDRKRYLEIIRTESRRLARLIEEFLDVSKIESGNFTIACVPIELCCLVQGLVAMLDDGARRRIDYTCEAKGLMVNADPDKCKSVFLNIIDNALRYSPAESKIRIRVSADGSAGVIAVADAGPGIAPEERTKVFQKFYRGKNAVTEQTPGSGLGLAIAKAVIDAHKGKLWCENGATGGAVFFVALPAYVKE